MTDDLTDKDAAKLARMIVDEMTERKRAHWIEPEIHSKHHNHVAVLIRREEDLAELKKKIIYSACMWAVPLIIAFMLSSFWGSLVKAIKGALR
jgi:hypothetical protein